MSKAARRKRKRMITLSGGTSVPQRHEGRDRRHTNQREREPRQTVFDARARQGSLDPQDPLSESEMGLCILALTTGRERDDLRETWAGLSAAWRNYCLRYLGMPGSAQGAAIAMVPDRMEADTSMRVDIRTPGERDEAAKRAWDGWHSRIAALPAPQHRWAIRGALAGFIGEGQIWRDAAPTSSGRVAVIALKMLTHAQNRV